MVNRGGKNRAIKVIEGVDQQSAEEVKMPVNFIHTARDRANKKCELTTEKGPGIGQDQAVITQEEASGR